MVDTLIYIITKLVNRLIFQRKYWTSIYYPICFRHRSLLHRNFINHNENNESWPWSIHWSWNYDRKNGINSGSMNWISMTTVEELKLMIEWIINNNVNIMIILQLPDWKEWLPYFIDEQERVQKKTFINWINSYLSKVSKTI